MRDLEVSSDPSQRMWHDCKKMSKNKCIAHKYRVQFADVLCLTEAVNIGSWQSSRSTTEGVSLSLSPQVLFNPAMNDEDYCARTVCVLTYSLFVCPHIPSVCVRVPAYLLCVCPHIPYVCVCVCPQVLSVSRVTSGRTVSD